MKLKNNKKKYLILKCKQIYIVINRKYKYNKIYNCIERNIDANRNITNIYISVYTLLYI